MFSIQYQISRTHLHYGIRDTTFAEPLYDRQLGGTGHDTGDVG